MAQGYNDDDDSSDDDGRFAKRLAGAYLLELDTGGAGPFRGLVNVMADGNIVAEETDDFGIGIPDAFQSGSRGAWRRTGKRRFEYTVFILGYDANGINTVTAVIHVDAKIGKGFDRWNLTDGTIEVFAADQDPLDPDEVPMIGVFDVFPGFARRIPARR